MGFMLIVVIMMALGGSYALAFGRLRITDLVNLSGWRARLTGTLWILPWASLLLLWALPGYQPDSVATWPLFVLTGVGIVTIVILTRQA